MKYKIVLSKSSEKMLAKIEIGYYKKIEHMLSELSNWPEVPENFDIKKLMNEEATYRIRVGVYRIIFIKYEDCMIIEIADIATRQNVYK